jgi:hypothetical protein
MEAFAEGKISVNEYTSTISQLAKEATNRGLSATVSRLHGIGGLTR